MEEGGDGYDKTILKREKGKKNDEGLFVGCFPTIIKGISIRK
ncbi:hypothetical protein BLGI_1626 [Brevibacillus laterosporus GI-9]|nr:hypothetical protein BLGI_1626 [Brevibacillus laterosporus GI-9]